MGLNGAGKTSLLRVLAGDRAGRSAIVPARAPRRRSGYYAQEHEGIRAGRTILASTCASRPPAAWATPSSAACSGMFGLTGDKVLQDAGTLSGGEKTKLALAQLVAGRHNLLLLDEPTNNLDPGSREAVAEALRGWGGSIMLVSHDAAFVRDLEPDRVLLMPEGTSTTGTTTTSSSSPWPEHRPSRPGRRAGLPDARPGGGGEGVVQLDVGIERGGALGEAQDDGPLHEPVGEGVRQAGLLVVGERPSRGQRVHEDPLDVDVARRERRHHGLGLRGADERVERVGRVGAVARGQRLRGHPAVHQPAEAEGLDPAAGRGRPPPQGPPAGRRTPR